jgi:hypothetical protein
MIHAYFDDSSDSSRVEFVGCGGVFGEAFNMTVVENLWCRTTEKLKQPFHSTDCECGHGQFREWKKEARIDLMADLVGILCDEALQAHAVGNVVPVPLYRETFPDYHSNDPNRLALRHTFIQMARIARKKGDRVRCWFEKGSHEGDIVRAHEEVSTYRFADSSLRNRLSGLEFGNKTLPLLQAADLLAREGYKAMRNMGVRGLRKPLLRMWTHTGILGWGSENMKMLQGLGNPLALDTLSKLPDSSFMMEMEATPYSQIRRPI